MAETLPDIQGLLPHRACRNCVQIKVKCIPQSGSNNTICERCHRLHKTCTTPAPATRKRPRHKISKVAQLEDRINRLSSLLAPSNASPDSNSDHSFGAGSAEACNDEPNTTRLSIDQNNLRRPDLIRPVTPSETDLTSPADEPEETGNPQEFRLSTILAPPHLSAQMKKTLMGPAEICPVFLDTEMEKMLFTRFRTEMLPFLPLVTIPAAASTHSVKKERPFVFWAACAVASYHTRVLHGTINNELIKCIAEQMLSKGHKSLDLLQGLLILISWFHYYGHLNACLIALLQLAQAQVIDLGLNKPTYSRDRTKMSTDTAEIYHGHRVVNGLVTSEERRALLGVYYWTSTIALSTGRLEAPRFTAHIERCCQDLENARELPDDELFVQLVRLHHTMDPFQPYNMSPSKLPLRLYMSMFDEAMRNFQAQLPPSLKNDRRILIEITSCKACFYGCASLRDDEDATAVVELMHSAMATFTEMTRIFKQFVPMDIANTTFAGWFVMTHVTGTFAELSFLKYPAWDLRFIRQKYSFPNFLQCIIDVFGAIARIARDQSEAELAWRFDLYGSKFRRCLRWYEARVDVEERVNTAAAPEDVNAIPDTFTASMFDGFDDAIWQDIMGDWTNY